MGRIAEIDLVVVNVDPFGAQTAGEVAPDARRNNFDDAEIE